MTIPPPLLEKIGLRGDLFKEPQIAMFHVHTCFSHDSAVRPEALLDFAKKSAVSLLCVTDHGTTKGSYEAAKVFRESGSNILVPVGMEVYAKGGHIGCIGIKEDITAKAGVDVVEEVRSQGGISIYNHPFQHGRIPDIRTAELVDFIEYPNNRTSASENLKALQLAIDLRKPVLPGCDAHQTKELRQGLVQISYDPSQNLAMATPVPSNGLTDFNKIYEILLKTVKNRQMNYLLAGFRRFFQKVKG